MKHFLFGVVFGGILFPIFEDIAQLISSGLEVFTTTFQKTSMARGLEIAKLKKEIENTMGDGKEEHTNIIGFAMPSSDDDAEEEDD